MIHVGYGEYADMDPRRAAPAITNLPMPELTPPPNQPDRQLWTGYWSAGRAGAVGLESDFIRKVVEAYDLTCTAKDLKGRSVYSEKEQLQIEKNLLLESTLLLVCDKKINNKSVSNRTAVGLVGLCTGHPGLIRFGLEGFRKATEEWFLPDGTTSESNFYGLMTLGGIWDFAQASKGYSDPIGYYDANHNRIEGLNLYESKTYANIWEGFFNGLQGDLIYPPSADHFLGMGLDPSYVELMVANYPDRPHYLDLLRELCGTRLERPSGPAPENYFEKNPKELSFKGQTLPLNLARPSSSASFSLYYRNPEIQVNEKSFVKLNDWNPSHLRIGYLRTGDAGRESLVTLNASHWGAHHESDSLNLYYWKNGVEVLSDLGYLWDHPRKWDTVMQTFTHNTVLIDGKEQRKKEREGTMHYFYSGQQVKFMEASSLAYADAEIYRRCVALVDHGNGQNYVADFFYVKGGLYQDYLFHTNKLHYSIQDLDLTSLPNESFYLIENLKKGRSEDIWQLSWELSERMSATAWMIPEEIEEVFIGDGWGQRDWKNSDKGTTIPYVVRRTKGHDLHRFIAIYDGHATQNPFVKSVQMVDDVLEVETRVGTDYLYLSREKNTGKKHQGHDLEGHFAALSVQNGQVIWKSSIPQQP